jgi:phosphinothricin acetyltransferase
VQTASEDTPGNRFEIRVCTSDDLPAICAIYNHYIVNTVISFEEEPLSVAELERRVAHYTDRHPWLVSIADGEVAGYAHAGLWQERSAYRHSLLTSVYVRHTDLGKGHGKALYEVLLAELATTDCHAIVAGIALPNAPSVALHERFGFAKVAHFPEVGRKFGRWVDVGYWQLTFPDHHLRRTEQPQAPGNGNARGQPSSNGR